MNTNDGRELVGTVWASAAGNVWLVVAWLEGGRVIVAHETEGHTHVWHHTSVTGPDMRRLK